MTAAMYRVLARLPLSALYGLSTLAAKLLEHVIRYRRRTVDANLAQAFPNKSAQWRREIRGAFYANLCDTTVEIIAGSRQPLSFFSEHITIRNPDLLVELSQQGRRSVLVMLAHQGNWEWMLHRAAAQYDVAMAFVYKRLHSAAADEFSLRARGRFGAAAIEMRDAARNFIRHRRTPRFIYMLADQSPGLRERVHVTSFLNRQTAFFSGAATLAQATGFPVAFAQCRRTQRGYFDVEIVEITREPTAVGEAWILERYAQLAEKAIQEAPDDWLWSNRRWKHQVPTASDSAEDSSLASENQPKPDS